MYGVDTSAVVTNLHVPIHVEEPFGLRREDEAIRIGIPLLRGMLAPAAPFVIVDARGRLYPSQGRPLARWSDRSIKWLLVDALVQVKAHETGATFSSAPRRRLRTITPSLECADGSWWWR